MAGALKGRIVIADDDAHTRNLLKDLADAWGYEALVAEDGEQALAHLATTPAPCLALLDLMMPKVDGFGVLRKIRETPATRAIPVILLTAAGEVDVKLEGMALGADDYVTKPFRIGDLQKRIEAATEKRRGQASATTATPEEAAPIDALTGVGTYPQLKETLAHECDRARRYGRPLSALLVAGDAPGDASDVGERPASASALVPVLAESLRRTFRNADRVFRIGFDAFVVLLPETPREGAMIAATRYVATIKEKPLEARGAARTVTVSVGVADHPRFGKDKPDDLVRAAHHALERGQRIGPARVELATDDELAAG